MPSFPHTPRETTTNIPQQDPGPPGPAEARSRRTLTLVFVAAAFGMMAVLSVPASRLPSVLRPLVPILGPVERLLHPAPHVHHLAAGYRPPSASATTGSGGAGSATIPPSGPGRRGSSGPSSTTGQAPGPAGLQPAPALSGSGSDLLDQLSRKDRRTVQGLIELVQTVGADRLAGPLARASRRPDAVATLLALIDRQALDTLTSRVTAAEVHALLADLRGALSRVLKHVAVPGEPGASLRGTGSRTTIGGAPGERSTGTAGHRSAGAGDHGRRRGHRQHHHHRH